TVSATTTLKAIAAASGFANSAVRTSTLTINLAPAATPAFTPAPGSYPTAQNVTLTDSTTGAAIYFTTDGSTPTTSSALYTGPIPVASSKTIRAIAAASGFSNSAVATGLYTIGNTSIGFASGFTAGSMVFNGSAALNATKLQVTD